jgi:hypothetical protein
VTEAVFPGKPAADRARPPTLAAPSAGRAFAVAAPAALVTALVMTDACKPPILARPAPVAGGPFSPR